MVTGPSRTIIHFSFINMNFSHLNFGNNFVAMHQFSSGTKVVGNVQQNLAFFPAPGTQHYQSHSDHVNFPNGVQSTTAIVHSHHNFQEPSAAVSNQNGTSNSTISTTTETVAGSSTARSWADGSSRIPSDNEVGKVNLKNCSVQNHGSQLSHTIQRPPRTVIMQSVGTMTDFDHPECAESKTLHKESIDNEDTDESSKSSALDNSPHLKSVCSNSCSKINLKSNASAMADYLGRLQPSSIPPNIQEFLERHNIKVNLNKPQTTNVKIETDDTSKNKTEIRMSTALDGSLVYMCPECQMAYSSKELLERHLTVHRGERKYECNVCGVQLKRKEHLDQHKKGHSEERPFVCEICFKGFKRNEHLRRHVVIHSGDKSHVCAQCGKAFSRKDHLNKHLQTHVTKRSKVEAVGPSSPLVQLQVQNNQKPLAQGFSSKQIMN